MFTICSCTTTSHLEQRSANTSVRSKSRQEDPKTEISLLLTLHNRWDNGVELETILYHHISEDSSFPKCHQYFRNPSKPIIPPKNPESYPNRFDNFELDPFWNSGRQWMSLITLYWTHK